MKRFRVQEAAARRIEDIYRYSVEHWGEAQANTYIRGLFEACDGIASGETVSRPIPAEFGVRGHFFRYRKHFV